MPSDSSGARRGGLDRKGGEGARERENGGVGREPGMKGVRGCWLITEERMSPNEQSRDEESKRRSCRNA